MSLREAHPECGCVAFLNEPKKTEWRDVFPDGTIPLQAPSEFMLPNGPPGAKFWIVDRRRLGQERMRRMAELAAAAWGAPVGDVLADYEKTGVAIRTIWTSGIAYCALHSRLLMA